MSSFEEAMPSFVEEIQPERLSTKRLLDDLRELANRDINFRRRQTDATGFSTIQMDSVYGWENSEGESDRTGRIRLEYRFEAGRNYTTDGKMPVEYQFSAVAEQAGVTVPEHIMADYLSKLDPDDEVELGEVTLTHAMIFQIGTQDRNLRVTEEFCYYDQANLVINSSSTDTFSGSIIPGLDSLTPSDHTMSDDERVDLPEQRTHRNNEELLGEWAVLTALEVDMADTVEQDSRNMKMAFDVLNAAKEALAARAIRR